jgi:hypothetical protein
LAGFGERLDETSALGVGEAAVVVGDALAEEFSEGGSSELFLLGGKGKRLDERNLTGELTGEAFGVMAVRGKDQNRTEALAEGAGDAAGPKTLDCAREASNEIVDLHFFEWDGALAVADDFDLAA